MNISEYQTKKPHYKVRLLYCGEGGIRTRGTVLTVRRFSKPLVSATHPPLQAEKFIIKSADLFLHNEQILSFEYTNFFRLSKVLFYLTKKISKKYNKPLWTSSP
jgi:hypothetical protein